MVECWIPNSRRVFDRIAGLTGWTGFRSHSGPFVVKTDLAKKRLFVIGLRAQPALGRGEDVAEAWGGGEGAEGVDDAVVGLGEGIGVEVVAGDPGVVGAFDMAGASGADAGEVGVEVDGEMAVGVGDGDEMGPDLDDDAHFFLQFAGDALGHGFALGDFAAGEFPQAGEHAFFGEALGDEDLVFGVENDGGADDFVGNFHFLFLDGEGMGGFEFGGAARAAQGAFGAAGGAGGADEGAEFHPGFVGRAGLVAQEEGVGELLEFLFGGGESDVVGEGEQAGEDANDVAVEHGEGEAEGEGGDGGGGVGAEAGEGGELGGGGGEGSAVVADEELGGLVELAGAGVVAEAFPEFEHVLEGGGGEGGGVGEAGKKAQEVGDDGVHAGLLEHDFRDPDGVRPARLGAPGQVAGACRKPGQQAAADGGAQGFDGWGRRDGHGGER